MELRQLADEVETLAAGGAGARGDDDAEFVLRVVSHLQALARYQSARANETDRAALAKWRAGFDYAQSRAAK